MTEGQTRSVFEYLSDILTSIDRIQDYVREHDFEAFSSNRMMIDAVLWNFIVIGEVASQLRRTHPKFAAENLDLALIVSARMRNFIVHEYFRVSMFVIWQTIVDDLQPLRLSTLRIRETA